MTIEVNNLTTNPVDEEFIIRIAEEVLKEEGLSERIKNKKLSGLSIALLGQGRMRKLNKKYRGKNRTTDVLSFGGKEGFWEVVVCLKEIKKNAKKYNSTFEKELARILIHGILHLLGYDHEVSEKGAKEMEKKEGYYLKKIT